jgi:hypothetical protein
MGRQIKIGEPFEGNVQLVEKKSRLFVTYVVVGLGGVLVAGAAAKGVLADGNFDALEHIWAVVGPMYGVISGYHFRTKERV